MIIELLEWTIPMTDLTLFALITSLVILLIGLVISKVLYSIFQRGLRRTLLSEVVVELLSKILKILLYVAIFLVFIASLGFDIGSVILGLSAIIGLILGLGMQDTVNNLVSGLWIAIVRPLDLNEFVSVGGQTGTVLGVNIMTTNLRTVDNKHITIPNKLIWNSSIENFTRMPTRRAAVDVGISFQTDLKKAIDVAVELMQSHPLVLEEPAPVVRVMSIGDSGLELQLRAWTANSDLWGVKWDLTGGIVKAFADNDIEIPYPKSDVHLKVE